MLLSFLALIGCELEQHYASTDKHQERVPTAEELGLPTNILIINYDQTPPKHVKEIIVGVGGIIRNDLRNVSIYIVQYPNDTIKAELQNLTSRYSDIIIEKDAVAFELFSVGTHSSGYGWEHSIVGTEEAHHRGYLGGDTKGDGIKVVIIDSGVNTNEPEIKHSLDPTMFYDVIFDDASMNDYLGHGTAVASIITAKIDSADTTDLIGVSPRVRLGSVNIFHSNWTTLSIAVIGISKAMEFDPNVISMSWGSYTYTVSINQAITRAYLAGNTLVAAAGNRACLENIRDSMGYPAKIPGVISVGSIGALKDGGRLSPYLSIFSSCGPFLDLVAPGENVTGIWDGQKKSLPNGTSFSAPFVTGAIALLLQKYPPLVNHEIITRLRITAQDFEPEQGWDKRSGYGILNIPNLLGL